MAKRVSIYSAVKMTGRYQDEMRYEAEMLNRVLTNHGFALLSPVLEENIPFVHELLSNVPAELLESHWKRDKQLIREADILLDYCTQNASDGANKELAYARYCLWKPCVRVWKGPGALISRMEDDIVAPSLTDAMYYIQENWSDYQKLGVWRNAMWARSFPKWMNYQAEMSRRYGINNLVSTKEVI
jgi:hypothetical protein